MTTTDTQVHDDLYQHYNGLFWTVCSCGLEFGGYDPDSADAYQMAHAENDTELIEDLIRRHPELTARKVTKVYEGPHYRKVLLAREDMIDIRDAIRLAQETLEDRNEQDEDNSFLDDEDYEDTKKNRDEFSARLDAIVGRLELK